MLKKRDKSYISELDRFLAEFDQQHPEKSDSQLKEYNKHKRVAQLRDNQDTAPATRDSLKDF